MRETRQTPIHAEIYQKEIGFAWEGPAELAQVLRLMAMLVHDLEGAITPPIWTISRPRWPGQPEGPSGLLLREDDTDLFIQTWARIIFVEYLAGGIVSSSSDGEGFPFSCDEWRGPCFLLLELGDEETVWHRFQETHLQISTRFAEQQGIRIGWVG